LAQLSWLLDGIRPSYAVTIKLFGDQRHDGGFAPFWAPDHSSLDATCYRLAQAESLGLDYTETHASAGLRFLNARQQPTGHFNEDLRLAHLAPAWAKPGDPAADLYITANAAFWLAQSPNLQMSASDSADYLKKFLKEETGQLPTFLNAYWLAAGLWWILDEQATAVLVLSHLQSRIPEMDAASLVWLLNTLRLAKVPQMQDPIPAALGRLEGLQENDGSFPSSEGQDVRVTLDALRAWQYYS
jgi:hypothetical protein